jgi:hypothetical protein
VAAPPVLPRSTSSSSQVSRPRFPPPPTPPCHSPPHLSPMFTTPFKQCSQTMNTSQAKVWSSSSSLFHSIQHNVKLYIYIYICIERERALSIYMLWFVGCVLVKDDRRSTIHSTLAVSCKPYAGKRRGCNYASLELGPGPRFRWVCNWSRLLMRTPLKHF